MEHFFVLFLLCLHASLFIDALWSPDRNVLTSWFSFVMSYCEVGILGQVWCLIVSIPDLCPLIFMCYLCIVFVMLSHLFIAAL